MRDPRITMDTVRTAILLGCDATFDRAIILAKVRDAADLERIGRAIHKLDEIACNGVPDSTEDPRKGIVRWTEEDRAANDKAVAKLMAKAERIATHHRLKVRHQGDCRGAALYIVKADASEWAI